MGGRWMSCHSKTSALNAHRTPGGYTVIRAGDTLVNPVSGETITFIETAAETGGDYTVIECAVRPGGGVPMAHVHPNQSETFQVLEGELSLKVGRDKLVTQPGDVVTVAPGTVHRFWNASDSIVRFRCTVTPSLGFEEFLQTICALGVDGKLNKRGMPSPLQLAVIANATFDGTRAPYVPAWMQKAGLSVGAAIGRLAGYKPTYTPTPAAAPAPATQPEPATA
jgi:quercetin dioxygenase-like cupin family protein